ncbi:sugar-binding domain-containing protein [Pelagicoccus albus]|uniref:Glycoside hydrolase family 2 protein n=1 Tax=Pelagicoccus albus TaxID=415222 RepID=A0A7X1B425_9BACT|nr:sugar-binding domain-containing protein [Pelagicoccus albus]MBC2605246.1 glycoside hydrolase family 2 protein [Pelagicoccus albus]
MFRIIALLCMAICLSSNLIGQGFGESKAIHDWKFHLGDLQYGGRAMVDESKWEDVRVPHDWTVRQVPSPSKASATGYLAGGIGWYRTHLEIPESAEGRRHYLYFEGVYNKSEVFINGTWLGKRPNGYVSFMYDISEYVKPGEENVVAVRVDHSDDADSRWYTGSGIYRDVFLVSSDPVHFEQWGITYGAEFDSEGAAALTLGAEVRNDSESDSELEVTFELFDAEGALVGKTSGNLALASLESGKSKQTIHVDSPSRWGVDSPYLYTLVSKITEDGQVRDRAETPVGIRSLDFDPNKGFALNGKWMKIKGVCLHHDAGTLGAAVPKEVWRERVLQLKEIGVNAIRMSHNPHAPDLYEVCDEEGVLVMDEGFDEWEYPKKKWLEGWNVGEPGFQGPAEFFREWAERDMESLVKRDRNHPSIIMWSIGNEVDYPNDPYSHEVLDEAGIGQIHRSGFHEEQPHADRLGGIAKRLAAVVRANDMTRPVTAALAGVVMSNETEYPFALDVAGYNYTESRYEMDHKKYPDRVIYGSENRHDLAAWKAVRDNDYIFGQFLWTGFDYLGEAGRWPSRGFGTGLIDQANTIKGLGYFRKALWTEEPMVYVGSYPAGDSSRPPYIGAPQLWNWEEGQETRVVAYTNCDAAELYLNGELVGKRKDYDDDTAIIYWDIPFQAGSLEVRAFRDGELVASNKVATGGAPVEIVGRVSSETLSANGGVALVYLEAHDEDGLLARLADNMVRCQVTGAGKLLGLENGSGDVTVDFTKNQLRFKNGRLLAYIQTTEEEGPIEVEFTSPYLSALSVSLKSVR